jgi:hypothetical protein
MAMLFAALHESAVGTKRTAPVHHCSCLESEEQRTRILAARTDVAHIRAPALQMPRRHPNRRLTFVVS